MHLKCLLLHPYDTHIYKTQDTDKQYGPRSDREQSDLGPYRLSEEL